MGVLDGGAVGVAVGRSVGVAAVVGVRVATGVGASWRAPLPWVETSGSNRCAVSTGAVCECFAARSEGESTEDPIDSTVAAVAIQPPRLVKRLNTVGSATPGVR